MNAFSPRRLVRRSLCRRGLLGKVGGLGGRSAIVLRDVAAEQEGPRVREYANIQSSN